MTCAFSSSLTTTVFSQRSMRRFDVSPRRATPKGHNLHHLHSTASRRPPYIRTPLRAHGAPKLIDDLVTESLRNGCERVLNLATGFDTRPYRLDLPAGIEWIEADLPEIINEKQRLLAGETARCRLSRVAVDLADAPSRDAFLADATSDARDTLVITEGLLLYLNEQQVRALAQDLHRAGISEWITDVIAPAIVRRMMRQMPSLDKAPMTFEPINGVAFFEQQGWTVGAICSILKQAGRWKRLPTTLRPVAYLPDPNPRKLAHAPWSGVVRFES